jgi:hypothetical protein
MSVWGRFRAWLRHNRPSSPPDLDGAPADHAETRRHAFWVSELLLDQLRDLEAVAEEVRHHRRRGE